MAVDVSTPRPASLAFARSRDVIRPRTTGEILDDAWRLYLAQAPLLLALSALFTVPAAGAFLWLLTRPRPDALWAQVLLPAATAVLLPLSGLGSGACQEAFRRQAEGTPVGLGGCLAGALRRGLDHVALRALVLALVGIGLFVMVMPGLAIWTGTSVVHAVVAGGEGRLFDALQRSAAEVSRQLGKALGVTLCRLPLLALAVLNLSAAVQLGLWVAGDLGGLDTALARNLLSLGNPVYLLALFLLAWILLSPFAEAANFLLHVDARARREGLDLWYRVQQVFPLANRGKAVGLLLALGSALLLGGVALGAEAPARGARLEVIREVRQRLEEVRREVERARPYPGGKLWLPRLQDLARQLDPRGSASRGPYRWFYQELDDFAARSQDAAVDVLTRAAQRLADAEAALTATAPGGDDRGEAARPRRLSSQEIKGAVPQRPGGSEREQPPAADEAKDPELRRPVVRRDNEGSGEEGAPAPRGPGVVPAMPDSGLGLLGWAVLAGLLLAIAVVAAVLFWQYRPRARPKPAKAESGKTEPQLENLLSEPRPETAAMLWRQAEARAKAGDYREAVRLLHAAVLALLHRANLIRYERTRTNGEYLVQARLHAAAPEELHEPFARLTGLFEVKWYGERECRPEDYTTCHGLAEAIRALV